MMKEKNKIYSYDQISQLDMKKMPQHISIIMDGNRRWANKKKLPYISGHYAGAERLEKLVKACLELKIKVLTVFAFSTENWLRSICEIKAFMRLFELYLIKKRGVLERAGVFLNVIKDITKIPKTIRDVVKQYEKGYNNIEEKRLDLVLALNYGGRDDILRGIKKIVDDVESKKINKEEISEKKFEEYLDTNKWGDPDILIRTSGEKRLSNFILWKLSYTEIFFTKTLWPDFSSDKFYEVIKEYQYRQRRGGV